MKKKMMMKESNCTPNLQLSLRPMSLGNGGSKEKNTESDEEADSTLSLALSPPVCNMKHRMQDVTVKHEIHFLQTLAATRPLRG